MSEPGRSTSRHRAPAGAESAGAEAARLASDRYDPQAIEPKWQARWSGDDIYRAADGDPRPKWYALTMFPYPSGDLHTGHWYAIAPSDAGARYRRMRGYNVLFPMGFDAFGLPAENAAIKRGIDPAEWTESNIAQMQGQLRMMGASFDWDREIITCRPDFYRWTQWWFLKLLEHGLAYRSAAAVNWCPGCHTVLANEQVVDGRCERSEDVVTRRFLTQWFFKITQYAEELLDFSHMEWPERIQTMQTNWIGRSEGATLRFAVADQDVALEVYTTRPDTLFGATFLVLAPEHPLVDTVTTPAQHAGVDEYRERAAAATDIDRLAADREKTGVATGGYAVNPATGDRIPIWIADYVLVTYGTGSIMAVPAHDQRDFEFATRFGLPIVPVFDHPEIDVTQPLERAFADGRRMIHSGPLDGTPADQAIGRAIEYAEAPGFGRATTTYRLRDWGMSRQRYWGCPIPIVYCDTCGAVPVPERDLPVTLPERVSFAPTGQSPLTQIEAWVHTSCPRCGAPARRETDTMDTFVCSSWYQLRYIDPHAETAPFSPERASYWLPVDQYTGGPEHAVMHLLYTRFFWKAARDMGMVKGPEPMLRLFNQGIILGPDGNRMSKRHGNVIAPDPVVAQHGTDAFRCQLMFIGPWDQGGPYNPEGMPGIVRWLHRIWGIAADGFAPGGPGDETANAALLRQCHQTIRDATLDIESFRFNKMISRLMELSTALARARTAGDVGHDAWRTTVRSMLLLIAPLAPHIAEELWERQGEPYSIHLAPWPEHDPALAREVETWVVIQVNGKLRDRLRVPVDIAEADAKARALESARVQAAIGDRAIRRFVYVPGRLANFVV
jgi:leucyl-tRNA synthetase